MKQYLKHMNYKGRFMKIYYPIVCFITSSLFATSVFSAIPDCKNLPNYIREFDRSMKVCVKDKTKCVIEENKIVTQEFSNNEGKLPKLKKPFSYIEGKYAEQGEHDKDNKFRLVAKIDEKNNFSERYYTSDHYLSFCKIN